MKKSDIILLCSVLAIALISFGIFAAYNGLKGGDAEEKAAVVRVNGEEYARLPLDTDAELLIEGTGGTNLLVIEDGKAYIKEASCPDLICVKTGEASELKTVVCLPNKVTVSIE